MAVAEGNFVAACQGRNGCIPASSDVRKSAGETVNAVTEVQPCFSSTSSSIAQLKRTPVPGSSGATASPASMTSGRSV